MYFFNTTSLFTPVDIVPTEGEEPIRSQIDNSPSVCTYSFLTAGTQHASMMPVRSAGLEDAKRFFIRAMINARTSIEIIVVYSF